MHSSLVFTSTSVQVPDCKTAGASSGKFNLKLSLMHFNDDQTGLSVIALFCAPRQFTTLFKFKLSLMQFNDHTGLSTIIDNRFFLADSDKN